MRVAPPEGMDSDLETRTVQPQLALTRLKTEGAEAVEERSAVEAAKEAEEERLPVVEERRVQQRRMPGCRNP